MDDGGSLSAEATARILTWGTIISATCFIVGLCLTVLGADPTRGDPLRVDQVIAFALGLRPWGWSMLGALVLIGTPAAGLIASVVELRADEPRTALLALGVIAILLVAVIVALVGA